MKVVITLVIAVVLLAIGIPLSRAIKNGDEHTITRTVDPTRPGTEPHRAAAARRPLADPAPTRDPSLVTQQQAAVNR
ncbi:hypothetical protein DSC_09710 [Pseudoxanthomonas spadix BD-a59]|jgi:hypothetical protein|uniref:Uncharacterized protein n=1 Tax=Pseudoxanthomonas spadix (strain BD-a59) TaxID=1045855 RepID=G7UN86_PSEUP|nr:hypothetical protein [Pseudoxanthomonas spadix]AER56590.1 hypothetical protein DSC_09710 [Pseudoxanthomonas spadix BD-a59]